MVGPLQVDAEEPVVARTAVAGGGLHPVLGAIALVAGAGLQHGFGAIGVVAQHDVDHAGHGIGAVDGRGAAAHQFDAFDEAQRQAAQVGEGALLQRHHGVARQAPAVDQEQRGARAHPVQAGGRRGAAGQVGRIAVARRIQRRPPVHAGQVAQQVEQRAVAAAAYVLALDHLHLHRGLQRRARQAAAGDMQWREFDVRCRHRGCGRGRRRSGGSGGWAGRCLLAPYGEYSPGRARQPDRQPLQQPFQCGHRRQRALDPGAVQSGQFAGVEQQRGVALSRPFAQGLHQWTARDPVLHLLARRRGHGRRHGQQRQAQQGRAQTVDQRTHCAVQRSPRSSSAPSARVRALTDQPSSSADSSAAWSPAAKLPLTASGASAGSPMTSGVVV